MHWEKRLPRLNRRVVHRKADDTEDQTEHSWPYDKPYYLILNIAVGGLGGPVAQEALPFVMEVDYVRVYQKKHNSISRYVGK